MNERGPLSGGRIERGARLGGLAAGQRARWALTRLSNLSREEEAARDASGDRTAAIAEALVEHLGEMKGAAMKLGQILSTVELGGLSEENSERIKAKLAELQARAPTMEFRHTRKVIEEDLGGTLGDHFADFEEEAFAAASIGQVHRARSEDGRDLAVKVQYPGVAEAVEADLRNLNLFVPIVRRLSPGIDAESLTAEVRERISEGSTMSSRPRTSARSPARPVATRSATSRASRRRSRRVGCSDPEGFEAERLLEQLLAAAEWLFEPGFRRLSHYVREVIERGGSPRSPHFDQMHRQSLPAASLLMRRMERLLLSVLGELRAGADWAAIPSERVAGAEPATELGEQEAAFWSARGRRTSRHTAERT